MRPLTLTLGFLSLIALSALAADRTGPFRHPTRSVRSHDVDQRHLRIELTIDFDKRALHGRAVHTLVPLKGVSTVDLDAGGMKIERVAIGEGEKATDPEKFKELKFQKAPESLSIELDRERPAGEAFSLAIDYSIEKPTRGGHFVEPHDNTPTSRYFWTQGEPEHAHFWVPCFDNPSDRLTSETIVTVPKWCTVVSNGKLEKEYENFAGSKVFHWKQDESHVTYLLTVAAGDFEVYEQSWDSIPVRAYVPRGRLADAARSFEKTPAMIEYFSQKIGVRYPWPKYAQVCCEDFMGGMENTSATTLTDDTLHDERAHLDFPSDPLVSHELAHQWWGDMITCKDWGDVWLNEGFAVYFATLWTEHDQGADEATWRRHIEEERYFDEDRNQYRRPIVCYSYEDPFDMFDAPTYPKAGRVLHMLRFLLGDEMFWKSLHHYAEKNRLRTVEAADLRIAIEETSGQGLGWFFDEWLLRAGHPEFNVGWRWDAEAKEVILTVRQTQKTDGDTPLFRTPVEIELASGDAEPVIRRVQISKDEETFRLASPERPTRVCFDPNDWILKKLFFLKPKEELLDQMAHDRHVMCRAQAIADFGLLSERRDADVEAAMIKALAGDSFWGVRQQAAIALGQATSDRAREALIAAATHDAKSTVRAEAVKSLANYPHDDARNILRVIIAFDQSYQVVAAALRTLVKIDRANCRVDLIVALKTPSHHDVVLQAACEGLAELKDASATPELIAILDSKASAQRRAIAAGALARMKPEDPTFIDHLAKVLDDSHPLARREVVNALVQLGDPRGIDLLIARQQKEMHSRLKVAIANAIVTLRAKTPTFERLNHDIESLRAQNRDLEERLKKLEAAKPKDQ